MESTYNFIERTQKIISQYDQLRLSKKDFFDVTLLLNCCVGLLFIAQEKDKDSFLMQNQPQLDQWFLNEQEITLIRKGHKEKGGICVWKDEEKTLANVCRHIRNSIAHCHFTMYADEKGREIKEIEFDDYLDEDELPEKHSFQFKISVSDFKNFLMKLSTIAIENIDFRDTRIRKSQHVDGAAMD